ncbi:two-component system sensor histidine kinase DesK [Geodermatophilus tzadiensis]|uniref:Two-component system sensor histidine kinase DesK n=1 Tax=Geodermatophilus tzadiensis TaxID=1137988 RepID=A0A2T0T665_9ACTN|nr:two-component system sensor histidine kinase DesK [Geodermatophilus tzadiensis]
MVPLGAQALRTGAPEAPAGGGRYGSMRAVPTVARWWSSRTDPQRLDLYTRSSFYGWLALTPALALMVLGSEGVATTPAAWLYLAGSVGVAVTGVVLVRAGLATRWTRRSPPAGPLTAALVAAAVTAGTGVVEGLARSGEPGTGWLLALPLAMLLTAASPVWTTRVLTRASAGVGLLVGGVVLLGGEEWSAALVLGVVFTVAVTGLVLAFRFSVWVLDVVVEMERTRGVQAQLAVAEERLRFARDLHDVMGRNLSVIAVKSQLAAELVRRGREGAVQELTDISRVAEESLREVRDVVRGYRGSDLPGELAGARSVLRAAGVEVTVSGEDGAVALPAPVQTALGWVVREAVTNVLRHSRATTCTIALSTSGGVAELRVVNDGVTGDGDRGAGLTGLAERLAAPGGRLSAGREGDRFVLTAAVPVGVPV